MDKIDKMLRDAKKHWNNMSPKEKEKELMTNQQQEELLRNISELQREIFEKMTGIKSN
jgi:hypothetical protein